MRRFWCLLLHGAALLLTRSRMRLWMRRALRPSHWFQGWGRVDNVLHALCELSHRAVPTSIDGRSGHVNVQLPLKVERHRSNPVVRVPCVRIQDNRDKRPLMLISCGISELQLTIVGEIAAGHLLDVPIGDEHHHAGGLIDALLHLFLHIALQLLFVKPGVESHSLQQAVNQLHLLVVLTVHTPVMCEERMEFSRRVRLP
mmetsp:Transcript_27953/g.61165  ORF Transcript_27953/g.61165 Transcript_27953/m.61165 type:complete len:200 (-) Transcript_27953:431-1030(-)